MSEQDAPITEQEPQPTAEAADQPDPQKPAEESKPRSQEDYEAEISKLRREAAGYRTKLREAEPIVKAHQQREEANKTELQKAQEALVTRERELADLQLGYTRLELAATHNIPPDDIHLIGSGSREEMEANAARLGALFSAAPKAPPSDRPVEGLRPGATPEPPKPVDNSYPANWGFQPQRQS